MVKILLNKAIISIKDEVYNVLNYSPDKELQDGYAYIIDDYVYPYRGKYNDMLCTKPGIYQYGNTHKIIEFGKSDNKKKYHIKNVMELDIDKMMRDIIENPDLIDDSTHDNANHYGDRIIPRINEDDDFLKYLIKQVLMIKPVYRSQIKSKFSKSHELSNLLQSLEKSTKMTVTNFKRWADILEIDWKIMVKDKNGTSMFDDIDIDSTKLY